MTDIKINHDVMQTIVHKAILEGIGTEQRDLLMQQALQYLITEPRNTYGSPSPSPLQTAFNNAVTKAARLIVEELVSESDLQDRIREWAGKALTEYVSKDYELPDAIGFAMGEAIGKALRDR